MKAFHELTEREVLALAISNEEEDGRIYADFAHSLREDYPDTAQVFVDMAGEEGEHRRELIDLFVTRFGDHIPLVRRQDVRGNVARKAVWQVRSQGVEAVRRYAAQMERDAERFYREAASRSTDAAVRKLLGDLADAEAGHEQKAGEIEAKRLPGERRDSEDESAKRRFILQIIQPGLVGLMDGSVSTLAPVFAAAFATHNSWNAFLVGIAASLGAGISMGFAEALADDGKLSGRGTPYLRGLVCGLMTIAGGIGHTLPYLIPNFFTATAVAVVVVLFELLTIAWIQWKYMETPPIAAAAKVMLGGGLVLATGILIGNA
ncbi:MAG: erythrin-vacuolar iron transport family protein [Methylobacteriaceae bacterium]|nr:erythrin-vacuolar iron transport family protein [Methylobacteriaceae bacterium]